MPDASNNPFKAAVLATQDISRCYQKGLQATGSYSRNIALSDTRKSEGSVNIDACVENLYPNENRWDFAIGYDGKVYFLEVHPAQTGEVRTVLKKLRWLKDWLNNKAPRINELKATDKTPYYWMQSGKFNILKTSRQYRQLATNGLLLVSKLKLP